MRPATRPAFTLVEVLIAIAVAALLVGLLAPALRGARGAAQEAVCLSNQRQLGAAWALYAGDFAGRAMPLGDEAAPGAEAVYWWGAVVGDGGPVRVDSARGYIAPYLDAGPGERSVFECAAQPWGTYKPQPMSVPAPGAPTSTYGYNGYYLAPPMTPGYSATIGDQAWKRLGDIERPTEVFVFADALLPSKPARNTALLDPPMLYAGDGEWEANEFPTTAFRHGGSAATARADGGARTVRAAPGWVTHPGVWVGSAGVKNGPHYIPDWPSWKE